MHRFRVIVTALAVSTIGLCATRAEAASLSVTSDPGTTYNTAGLTGFATFGDDMVGMLVTAFFSNSTSQTVVWTASGAGSGNALGTGWSLSESGDTFGGSWTLLNNSGVGLIGLVIDGGSGQTVFDRTNPAPGTTGSANGSDFLPFNLGSLDIVATYRDLVAVIPNAPVGDLYRVLDLRFNNVGGLATANGLSFSTDTDNATTALTPSAIPEPGSLVLLGSGLVAGLRRWRRRRGDVV